MVKLVVVDMDGTFLDDEKKKSPECEKVINFLLENNIYFCVASGRQMASIKREMEVFGDRVIYLSDNGTVINMNGITERVSNLSREITDSILERLKKMPSKFAVYCAEDYSYIDVVDEKTQENIKIYLPMHKIVDDFSSLDVLPVKISIYSEKGYDKDFGKLVDEFSDLATVCTSGFEWLDIIPKNSSKGNALRIVQERLGITKEETMVFGDQMNDFEMMNEAYYSYAMENAVDEIKQIARYTAPSNNEYGVIKVLKEFFNIK